MTDKKYLIKNQKCVFIDYRIEPNVQVPTPLFVSVCARESYVGSNGCWSTEVAKYGNGLCEEESWGFFNDL